MNRTATLTSRHYLIPLVFLVFIGLGAVLLYALLDSETSRSLLLKFDVLNVSETATVEKQRVGAIMLLPITYERKQALVDNKIFMGATPDMVKLALGPPKLEHYQSATAEASDLRIWHYYLPGDSRPTVMEFEKDTLIKAYKGSAIDTP